MWSTADSIRNGQPSVMAVIESCIAVTLYFWLALHLETLVFLYIAALIAPAVLLRSEESVETGLRWFDRFENSSLISEVTGGWQILKPIAVIVSLALIWAE